MANFLPWEYAKGNKCVRVATGATPNPKKMTGTRLGAVIDLNKWKSPFAAWCEICRVAEEPFEGNKFTEAGTVIEPKIIAWAKECISPYLVTPEQFYHVKDAKKHTGYDFFAEHPVFGGMWDALVLDGKDGNDIAVVEAKTSSRPQDWVDGVPDSYAVQALLYAFLRGLKRAFVAVSFLEPKDYDDPEAFECTDENTYLYELNVDTSLIGGSTIAEILNYAEDWWQAHVVGNKSPQFDEVRDKVFLGMLRKSEVKVSDDIATLAAEALRLDAEIEALKLKAGITALEKQKDKLKGIVKAALIEQFGQTDQVVAAYGWKVKKSQTETVDKDKLKEDGLMEYITVETTYTMTKDKESNNAQS